MSLLYFIVSLKPLRLFLFLTAVSFVWLLTFIEFIKWNWLVEFNKTKLLLYQRRHDRPNTSWSRILHEKLKSFSCSKQ
jgi:hypothetical protein